MEVLVFWSATVRSGSPVRRFTCNYALFSERTIGRASSAERTIASTMSTSRPAVAAVVWVFGLRIVRSEADAEPSLSVFVLAALDLLADKCAFAEAHAEHLLGLCVLPRVVAPHLVGLV